MDGVIPAKAGIQFSCSLENNHGLHIHACLPGFPFRWNDKQESCALEARAVFTVISAAFPGLENRFQVLDVLLHDRDVVAFLRLIPAGAENHDPDTEILQQLRCDFRRRLILPNHPFGGVVFEDVRAQPSARGRRCHRPESLSANPGAISLSPFG